MHQIEGGQECENSLLFDTWLVAKGKKNKQGKINATRHYQIKSNLKLQNYQLECKVRFVDDAISKIVNI